MTEAIVIYLPWLLSGLTAWMMFLAGDNNPRAWLLGLGTQALWLVWICAASAWGLLPMNLLMWWACARNYRKWSSP